MLPVFLGLCFVNVEMVLGRILDFYDRIQKLSTQEVQLR